MEKTRKKQVAASDNVDESQPKVLTRSSTLLPVLQLHLAAIKASSSLQTRNLSFQASDMDIAGVLVGFVQCFWAPVTRQLHYLKNTGKDAEILRHNIEELSGREKDIRIELDRAVNHFGKKCNNEVQIWLENVENVRNEVTTIETDLKKKARYMKGCFPNCRSRLNLGKLIKHKNKQVAELQGKGGFPNGLFVDPLPEKGKTMPTTALVGKTAARVSELIWKCLMDAGMHKIGVCGMGGIGKTTILMHINNQLNESQMFDSVIWVTVSKQLNLEKLQYDVARAIDLDISEDEDEALRSTRLFEALLRKKKFVLILDNLWRSFDLEKIGIPCPSSDNGCKLLFTTRLMEVCRGMETQKEIKVDILSKEEAWHLFIDKVGSDVVSSSEIETMAKKITDECGGLPLALITVGRAMRKVNNPRVWRNALEELKNSRAEIDGMEDDVFARLRFSYNHLKNDKIRACLLYCALYPEDHEIDIEEIIEYWMAEGLIDEVGNREKEIDKGHSILKELKDACMLESIGSRCVKMHDLVRDLSISITRETPRFVIHAATGLKRFPQVEMLQDVERISLMGNCIQSVRSDNLMVTRLSTLLLQRNCPLKSIENSFFEHMHNLRVLDLSETDLKVIPGSLSNLQNLHFLSLRFCKIKRLPSLAKLKELRVLDLSYTFIRILPRDIGSLVNLRRLDLSYTEKLNELPRKVLPRLNNLENLSMFKSRCRWSSDTLGSGRGASLQEIVNFERLVNLGISFKDLSSFISYVKSEHWKNLSSFHLGIGLLSRFVTISRGNFSVEIQGCDLVSHGSSIVLPENTQQLALQGCHDITELSKLPCISKLNGLRDCYISKCNRIEYISMTEENIFPSLEKLILRRLPNLSALSDRFTGGIFARLRTMHVHGCNSMRTLFSHGLLQNIQNIEEIEVWNCILMEAIMKEEEITESGQTTSISLPKLRRLFLFSLPNLRSICGGILICNSLTSIEVWDCRKLKKLPVAGDKLPFDLKNVRGSRMWWDALEWEDKNAKIMLEPFFEEDKEEDEAVLVEGDGEGDGDEDGDATDDDNDDDDSDDDSFETAR